MRKFSLSSFLFIIVRILPIRTSQVFLKLPCRRVMLAKLASCKSNSPPTPKILPLTLKASFRHYGGACEPLPSVLYAAHTPVFHLSVSIWSTGKFLDRVSLLISYGFILGTEFKSYHQMCASGARYRSGELILRPSFATPIDVSSLGRTPSLSPRVCILIMLPRP
jgi:hypothetical protein